MRRGVGLGFPPDLLVRGQARLPAPQNPTLAITANLRGGVMTRDALRISSGPRACLGYLASPQVFTRSLPNGAVNSPASMGNGLRLANAPRLVNRTNGASAGM